jgi:hypothetical protein
VGHNNTVAAVSATAVTALRAYQFDPIQPMLDCTRGFPEMYLKMAAVAGFIFERVHLKQVLWTEQLPMSEVGWDSSSTAAIHILLPEQLDIH